MKITENQVYQMPHSVEPTDTWNPVPHPLVKSRIDQQLRDMGIDIVSKRFEANKEGTQLFAFYQVRGADSIPYQPDDYEFAIGWRNSIDKTISLQMAFGINVLVCSNMSFHGDWLSLRRKHSGRFTLEDVDKMLHHAAGHLDLKASQFEVWRNGLQEQILPSGMAWDHLLMEAYRRGLIPPSKLGHVDKALSTELDTWGDNLWGFHNVVTRLWRDNSLNYIASRSGSLERFLQEWEEAD